MEAIFNEALTVAPVLGMVLTVAAALGVFLAMAGNILSRQSAFSNRVGASHCSLCFWHLDKV